jgi:hypothetical protein
MRAVMLCVLAMTAACGAASPATHGRITYAIHIGRRVEVGRHWVEVDHYDDRQRRRVRDAAGAIVEDESYTRVVDMTGEYTVLAVDEHARAVELRLVISAIAFDVGHGTVTQPTPIVLRIDVRDERRVTGDHGEAIDPGFVAALDSVLPEPAGRYLSDEGSFGTSTPRAVGAEWPIDRAVMARGLAIYDLPASPDQLSGNATLVDALRIDGRDVLQLRARVTSEGVPMSSSPGGVLRFTYEVEWLLPVDEHLGALRQTVSMVVEAAGPVADSAEPRTFEGEGRITLTRSRLSQ